jgi:ADP-ribosylglycohydrolase
LITDESRWIPEFGRKAPLLERLFYPEKWLFMRLHLANAEPREGGIGNMVNCGAAMYASPVGIVNAGDPVKAYNEAVDIFSAHQHSFGLEAAAVMAACTAEAFRSDATVDSIIDVALSLSKDGTYHAINAVIEEAKKHKNWKNAITPLREIIRPYDGSAEFGKERGDGTNNWRPSREHSIEELPIALAFIVISGDKFEESIFGAANYGRDNDSIAGMSGGIMGALNGAKKIRNDWIEIINQSNRIDLDPIAENLYSLVLKLQKLQLNESQKRDRDFSELKKEIIE